MEEQRQQSGLGVASLVLGIIALLTSCIFIGILPAILSLIFSIITLCQKRYKKGMAIAGLVLSICSMILLILLLIIGIAGLDDVETEDITTEDITAELTTELQITEQPSTEESTEISEEDFKNSAEEVTYEDIYRNPETYRNKPIKITVYVNEYDTQFLGFVNVYYCQVDNQDIFLTDTREVAEPTIAKGDTVTIYGLGAGLATLTESQKNILGITTNSEKSQIPSVDIKYAEIQ